MLTRHVRKQLNAYCQGELSPQAAARVAAHLERCPRCRQEYEEIQHGHQAAQHLTLHSAPESLWNRIEAALPESRRGEGEKGRRGEREEGTGNREQNQLPNYPTTQLPNTQHPTPNTQRWRPALALGAAGLVLIGAVAVWRFGRHTGSSPIPKGGVPVNTASWEVTSLKGAPAVGNDLIRQKGRLYVGQRLVTDAASKARIQVANIGQVEIGPNSRVRLVQTSANEHRLALDVGALSAQVTAPPRLFFVETPTATAVDLGCAYTLRVDLANNTFLHVTKGRVALELHGREIRVPQGSACETRPGLGPGTPYFEDAPKALRAALEKYDFEQGGANALKTVLANARATDTLTLWYLLFRAPQAERGPIVDRLMAYVPPPVGVTREAAIRLDPKAIALWKPIVEMFW